MRTLRPLLLGALSAAGTLLPAPALAQTLTGDPIEVTVTAPRADRAFESSRATTLLDASQLRLPVPRVFADTLRHQPGISIQQTSPSQGTIFLRGLSGREVVHLVDGVRLNTTLFRAGNNPSLGLLDPYGLAAVQLVRGSSSVLHGSDAMGGVILATTRVPAYAPSDLAAHLRAVQGLTTNPAGGVSHVASEVAGRRWAFHAGVTFWDYGDIRPGGGLQSPDPSSFHAGSRDPQVSGVYAPRTTNLATGTDTTFFAANSTARVRLGADQELLVRVHGAIVPTLTRVDEITPRFKRDAPARAQSEVSPMSRTMASATWVDSRPRGPLDQQRLTIAWQRIAESVVRRDLEEVEQGARLVLVPAAERLEERNRSDAFSARWELASTRARVLGGSLGAECVHDRVGSSAQTVPVAAGPSVVATPRFPSGSTQTQLGLFSQVEVRPWSWLRAHAGVRAALFLLDIAERSGAGITPSPASTSEHADAALQSGVRVEFAKGIAWVANVGRALRAPNVQDLSTLGPRAGGRTQLPNPALGPEHTWSLDTGLKTRRGPWQAEVFVFVLDTRGAISVLPTSAANAPANADPSVKYVTSRNAVRTVLWGTEAATRLVLATLDNEVSRVSAAPGALGVWARWLAMWGEQMNAPDVTPARTPADRVPPAQGTLGAWGDVTRAVTLEAWCSFRLRQARLNDPLNLDDNRIPEAGTPGYATLHARARWVASQDLMVQASVDNVLNAVALDHGSGFELPGFSASALLAAAWR